VHWGVNGWKDTKDIETTDTGIGVHVADLTVARLAAGAIVQFTFLWRATDLWEGQDYQVLITG
jgi:glucoamylase